MLALKNGQKGPFLHSTVVMFWVCFHLCAAAIFYLEGILFSMNNLPLQLTAKQYNVRWTKNGERKKQV